MSNGVVSWRDGRNMSEQYLYMFEQGLYTDCTFHVEDQQIGAHRLVVGRASPVFEAMFLRHEMSEAKTGVVNIIDISYQTFQAVLRYMYSEKVDLGGHEDTIELCLAADKYQLDQLKLLCVDKIKSTLTSDNVWQTLALSQSLQLQIVTQHIIKLLQNRTSACCTSDYFLETGEEQLVLLLSQDILSLDGEHSLILLVERWVRYQAKQRGLHGSDQDVREIILPRLLPLVRLVTLKPDHFSYFVKFVSWLSDEEKLVLASRDVAKFPDYLCKTFKPRKWQLEMPDCLPLNSEMCVPVSPKYLTYKHVKAKQFHKNVLSCCKLSVSEDMLLHGLVVSSQVHPCRFMSRVLESSPAYNESFTARFKSAGTTTSTVTYAGVIGYDSAINLRFTSPVVLSKGSDYNIIVSTSNSEGTYNFRTVLSEEFMFRNIVFTLTEQHRVGIGIVKSLIISTNK